MSRCATTPEQCKCAKERRAAIVATANFIKRAVRIALGVAAAVVGALLLAALLAVYWFMFMLATGAVCSGAVVPVSIMILLIELLVGAIVVICALTDNQDDARVVATSFFVLGFAFLWIKQAIGLFTTTTALHAAVIPMGYPLVLATSCVADRSFTDACRIGPA